MPRPSTRQSARPHHQNHGCSITQAVLVLAALWCGLVLFTHTQHSQPPADTSTSTSASAGASVEPSLRQHELRLRLDSIQARARQQVEQGFNSLAALPHVEPRQPPVPVLPSHSERKASEVVGPSTRTRDAPNTAVTISTSPDKTEEELKEEARRENERREEEWKQQQSKWDRQRHDAFNRGRPDDSPYTRPSSPLVEHVRVQGPDRCEPMYPKTIIYNRIPKASSGTMNIWIGNAQREQPFLFCRSNMYRTRKLTRNDEKRYAGNPWTTSNCKVADTPKKNELAVLSRHVFFVDFGKFNASRPFYINVIRHPVDRCISRFYYERNRRATTPKNMDMDTCMKSGPCNFEKTRYSSSDQGSSGSSLQLMREECSTNYLTKWFCGMDTVCAKAGSGSRQALEVAKKHLLELHEFVGLSTEMPTTFKVLQRLAPDFFAKESRYQDASICNKCKSDKQLSQRSMYPKVLLSEEGRAKLAEINALDMELYDFAVDLFQRKARACGIELPSTQQR